MKPLLALTLVLSSLSIHAAPDDIDPERQQFNADVFPGVVRAAFAELASGETKSPKLACYSALSAVQQQWRSDARDECAEKIGDELRQTILSGRAAPRNCGQWAMKTGKQWESAGEDMQASVLAGAQAPTRFSGKVLNAEGKELVVYHDSENAVVRLTPQTTVFNASKVKINGRVSGYGIQTGMRSVQLVSGQHTKVPVIEVHCIDA